MKKYYHVITERNDEYVSTVAIADSIETVKAHFAGQNIREIIELNAAQVNTISAAATSTVIDITAEQDNAPAAPDYTALAETIRAELNARHDRSAWDKAVTLYALDLLDDVQSHANEHKRAPVDGAELELWALNGADNWHHYSTGACSLVWSGDIAARVCTPSMYKRKHEGASEPGNGQTWLDVQADALKKACWRIRKICRSNGLYYKEG